MHACKRGSFAYSQCSLEHLLYRYMQLGGTHWSGRNRSSASCHQRLILTATGRLTSSVLRLHMPLQSALGADQLAWFLNDLARVNRAVTPWVTVSWHQPPVRSPPPFQSNSALCGLPYVFTCAFVGPIIWASLPCAHIYLWHQVSLPPLQPSWLSELRLAC